MDPVTTAALEAARRYVLRKILRWTAVLLPLVMVACLALIVYATLIFGGSDAEVDSAGSGSCSSIDGGKVEQKQGDLTGEQVANAKTIVAVGNKLKVSKRGILVALMTALQESNLNNVPYGDRDSVGLFQQREAWGSNSERMDPATSTTMFFTGGRQGQPGLLDVDDWKGMDLTVAAQTVQASAFPTAYAKWEETASKLLGEKGVGDAKCSVATVSTSSIVEAARKWLGTPYSWGGGGIDGPSEGFAQGAGTKGFDCSSLVQNAVYSSTGVTLPRTTGEQAKVVEEISFHEAQAGDLLFFLSPGAPAGSYHHVGIYDGKGGMVHAPRTGKNVEVVSDVRGNPYWKSQLALVGRVSGAEAEDQYSAA